MGWLRGKRSVSHGSAGWGKPPRSFYAPAGEALPAGALHLGRRGAARLALPRSLTLHHAVILGPSGTGKSRGYLLETAARSRNASFVCTDPKGELFHLTSGFHPCSRRFAPTEPWKSEGFNFVPLCAEARISELCARAIVESGQTANTEQAWLDAEAAYLSALLSHASTLLEPTLLSVYDLFTTQDQESLLGQLLASASPSARRQARIFEQTQERMRGSIVPVVASKLLFMNDPSVARFTSATREAPDFSSLRREAQALYWVLPEREVSRLRPLSAVFFSLLLHQLSDGAPSGEAPGCAVPVTLLLDEFANIGRLPAFETTISLARGRDIAIVLCLQSLSQLEGMYGRSHAQTILTNTGTKIALHGLDFDSADYISRSLGMTTVVTPRKSSHRRWFLWQPTSSTVSSGEHGRPLLTADEVRRIGVEEAIVIQGNLRPMLLGRSFYSSPACEGVAPALGEARTVTLPRLTLAGGPGSSPPAFPSELETFSSRRVSLRSVKS